MDPTGTFILKSLRTRVSAANVLNAFEIRTADLDPVQTSSVFMAAIVNAVNSRVTFDRIFSSRNSRGVIFQ